jgi:ligand-binding SRPBCC domain-containing protein
MQKSNENKSSYVVAKTWEFPFVSIHLYMPEIELKTLIHAPPKVCFDLSLDIDLHMKSMKQSNERAVSGRVGGQIKLGETVVWKAKHFGFNFTMTIRIIDLLSPLHFTDEMVNGPFKYLSHRHLFEEVPTGTRMIDLFDFQSPMGFLGRIVDRVFLEKYMRALLAKRNSLIKETAECITDKHL